MIRAHPQGWFWRPRSSAGTSAPGAQGGDAGVGLVSPSCPAMWATRRRAPPRSGPVVAAIDRSSRGWTVCPAAPCSGDAPERESGPAGLSDLRESPRPAGVGVGASPADDGHDVQASGMRRWPLTCSVPSASHSVIATNSADLRRTGSTASSMWWPCSRRSSRAAARCSASVHRTVRRVTSAITCRPLSPLVSIASARGKRRRRTFRLPEAEHY
jgi:hypothetical protein